MNSMIKLGYEVGTGKEINISPSHLLVTGVSQKAGKTTALESMAKQCKKTIVFRTKIGEKSFLDGTVIPPYFKEKSDWQYIEGLIEATMKEKVGKLDRAVIIKLSKLTGGKSLLEFKKVVDNRLLEKISTFEEMLLTNLQAYLEIVIPKLQTINFSNTLELVSGLNIIDLERFSRDVEVQSLIIASVLEEVLNNHKDVIVIIPEAWKFIPQKRGNPCKMILEEFIRQGATNRNYIWIDSQDMAGVDKAPLKQISEWILGYQSEHNEVKHTLDQIPLPKQNKPKEDEIMQLGTGIFIFASRDLTTKVYMQPFWLDDERSIKIAKGELNVAEIDAPKQIAQNKIALHTPDTNGNNVELKDFKELVRKDNLEMRTDFFDKVGDLQDQINKIFVDISELKTKEPELDMNTIVSLVLQKMPTQSSTPANVDEIISLVLSKIPKQSGSVTYEVAPLEKIKKDFIQEAKTKILNDIEKLSDDAKKVCKYVESRGVGITVNELVTKCFLLSTGGPQAKRAKDAGGESITIGTMRKDSHGKYQPVLKNRITELLAVHEPTDGEIENLYQHIIMELL